jgi:hypothetical protein
MYKLFLLFIALTSFHVFAITAEECYEAKKARLFCKASNCFPTEDSLRRHCQEQVEEKTDITSCYDSNKHRLFCRRSDCFPTKQALIEHCSSVNMVETQRKKSQKNSSR